MLFSNASLTVKQNKNESTTLKALVFMFHVMFKMLMQIGINVWSFDWLQNDLKSPTNTCRI